MDYTINQKGLILLPENRINRFRWQIRNVQRVVSNIGQQPG